MLGWYNLTSFHLEHSFYIDILNIDMFNTLKMLFVILLSISCKEMKQPSFLIHFSKRIDDKWWLGVRLGGRDRYAVVAKDVNFSWLRRSFCNTRVIV